MRGAEGAVGVDEEGAAKGDALFGEEDAVRLGDGVRAVSEEAELEVGAKTALLARCLRPGEVGVLRVGRDADDLGVDGVKLGQGLVEGEDLGGADDCMVSTRTEKRKGKGWGTYR